MIKFYNTSMFDVPESEKHVVKEKLMKKYNRVESLSHPEKSMILPENFTTILFRLDEEKIISIKDATFIMCLVGKRNDKITYELLAEMLNMSTKELGNRLNFLLKKGFIQRMGVIGYDLSPFSKIIFHYDEKKDASDKAYLINLVNDATCGQLER
ncbi:hypothetical protein [Priestia megaterium]|uniref:hypothetical protein n=1 Tax=Priestia megaterium TaxID=1404 RepID=UPI003000B2D0